VFENRVMRRTFRPERDEVTGEWRKLHNIISFISVDPYRIRNGKWSHNHRVYETIKTIFVSLAPYKLFDILR
jgi:hypothetical protein